VIFRKKENAKSLVVDSAGLFALPRIGFQPARGFLFVSDF